MFYSNSEWTDNTDQEFTQQNIEGLFVQGYDDFIQYEDYQNMVCFYFL